MPFFIKSTFVIVDIKLNEDERKVNRKYCNWYKKLQIKFENIFWAEFNVQHLGLKGVWNFMTVKIKEIFLHKNFVKR